MEMFTRYESINFWVFCELIPVTQNLKEFFFSLTLVFLFFKARKLQTNEFAAIKVIKIESGDDIHIIEQEILMMRDCRHPNIISYFGSYLRRDKLWICMEYCGGGSLQDIYQGQLSFFVITPSKIVIKIIYATKNHLGKFDYQKSALFHCSYDLFSINKKLGKTKSWKLVGSFLG